MLQEASSRVSAHCQRCAKRFIPRVALNRDVRRTAQQAATRAGITYTSYECNTFALTFNAAGARVLVDPWLVGSLTFGGTDWLFRGSKRVIKEGDVDIDKLDTMFDFILLTQALPDHCHIDTLKRIPKHIPIVAEPEAAKLVSSMGFTSVQPLDCGQTISLLNGKITMTGTEGALVGPPWSKRQLGVVFRDCSPSGSSLYFEPHCDFNPSSVSRAGQVDVVVSPVTSQLLAGYPLVLGDTNLISLLKILQPQVLVPLLNGDIDQTGPLAALIAEQGSVSAANKQIKDAGLRTKLVLPATPLQPLVLPLE